MSDRVSQFILLCEDEMQKRLAWEYMKKCGLDNLEHLVRSRIASRMKHGGNDVWVLDEFPKELRACRKRQAKSRLIVLIDADMNTVQDRLQQLNQRAVASGVDALQASDPVSILIPKRNIETWIQSLLGEKVTEEQDCKSWKKPKRQVIRDAAEVLYQWSRENAEIGESCVPSLRYALPYWQKIG